MADLFGAVVLGIGAGVCGWLIAPALEWPGLPLILVAGLIGSATGWRAMRAVPNKRHRLTLPAFELAAVELGTVDHGAVEPGAVDHGAVESGAFGPVTEEPLLLADALAAPDPDSRVVRLFAVDQLTAGQLAARIDQHRGGEPGWEEVAAEAHAADATDALHAALDEIRRSLRQR